MSTENMNIECVNKEGAKRSRDEQQWQAVLARDSSYNGEFVYAVRSTGVFCMPSCSSRRPGREQVMFFAGPETAREAGFRDCLRCKPGDAGPSDPRAGLVEQVCAAIEAGLESEEGITLEKLGAAVGVSPFYLQRVFKRVMGITPRQYAEARRVERLKQHLVEGQTVTDALYNSGYNSSSTLYEKSDAHLGMTPSAYRRGGEAVYLTYSIVDSPLGRLLVAATERGICAVRMGDTDEQLEATLREEYPAASIHRDEGAIAEWVQAILAGMCGDQPSLDLPLDVRATAFQWRVWEALRSIPYGSTRSYAQVAALIGQPGAVRAVASACAANPVAVVVPCHRVVRTDGSMGGYRWGVERKEALLASENAGAGGQDGIFLAC